jgi:membrane protease YdiL (CAAX protease family)
MLFRGVILRAFLVRHSRGTAIAASALIFGFAHLNIYQFAVAFLLGVVMGWLYERSRSLVAPIALHAFYNTTVSFVGLGMRDTVTRVSATTWVLSLVAGAVGALVLARLLAGPPARAAS